MPASSWSHAARTIVLLASAFTIASASLAQDDAGGRPATLDEFKMYAEGTFKKSVLPFIKDTCYQCHGNKKAVAGLNLEKLKPDFLTYESAEQWYSVAERMRDEEMPPAPPGKPKAGDPLPAKFDPAVREETAGWLENILKTAVEWRKDIAIDLSPIEFKETDDAVTRKLKQQRNAAGQAAAACQAVVERGIGQGIQSIEGWARALDRFYAADAALVKGTPAEIQVLRKQVANWRMVESYVFERYHTGIDSPQSYFDTKTSRLAAQVQLLRAMQPRTEKK